MLGSLSKANLINSFRRLRGPADTSYGNDVRLGVRDVQSRPGDFRARHRRQRDPVPDGGRADGRSASTALCHPAGTPSSEFSALNFSILVFVLVNVC